jgi:ABC-type Zn uptake system ZnuABC Zn-binding protein ZnuA
VLYVDSLSKEDGPVPTFLDLLDYNAKTIINGFLNKP